MKHLLKDVLFKALMAAMLCCITGCVWDLLKGESKDDRETVEDQTFDELSEMKFKVAYAYVVETYSKLFPYSLYIKITDYDGAYAFFSNEECTVQLQEDTLVTVNGKPAAGLYRTMTQYGDEFEVYLDCLPEEGAVAEFSQEWFFAMSYKEQKHPKKKARIVTESIPIQFHFVGEDPIDNLTFDELPVIEYEVTGATVRPSPGTDNPSRHLLDISWRKGDNKTYRYFSDEECENEIDGDALVIVDGNPTNPSGSIAESRFYVYLDSRPAEGAVAEFSREWFFAKPVYYPRYRKKVRIITESIVIKRNPYWNWD
jgi:hypothetical protein